MPAERQKEPDGPTLASHQLAVIHQPASPMAPLPEVLRGAREVFSRGLTTSPREDLVAAALVLVYSCSSAWSPEQQPAVLRCGANVGRPWAGWLVPARRRIWHRAKPSLTAAAVQLCRREIQRLGQLLVEQDGQLQALLAARGPADEDAHRRVWVAIAALASTLLLTVRLSTVQTAAYKAAAAALLRATRVLIGSGRLALAAAVQGSSRLSAELRYKLLQSNLMAGNAAWQLTRAEASHEPLLNLAAASAFQPADTAAWLQLVTSGLLSLCMGGPLAATLGEGKWAHM